MIYRDVERARPVACDPLLLTAVPPRQPIPGAAGLVRPATAAEAHAMELFMRWLRDRQRREDALEERAGVAKAECERLASGGQI